jgi:RHS repeat-associated protein
VGGQVEVTVYTVNEQNRLTQTEKAAGAVTSIERYHYDASGNVLARVPEALANAAPNAVPEQALSLLGQGGGDGLTPAVYSYDIRNRMVEAAVDDAAVTSVYNAEGLCMRREADGVVTEYCYEHSRVIKEVDSAGSVAYNVYGTSLISRDLDGQKAYYLYNGHGDVTALLSPSGVVLASYYYDAFGDVVEASGSFGSPYRYAGYTFDAEVRLYYLNARFYDAKIARFMQEDTYLGSKADPLSLNLYAYCRSNPLIYWDPSGRAYMTDEQYRAYAAANGISTTGAWKDTVDQKIINNGGNPSAYGGSGGGTDTAVSTATFTKNANGTTTGSSTTVYYDSSGTTTTVTATYTNRAVDTASVTVTNNANNTSTTLEIDQSKKEASVTFTDNGGNTQPVAVYKIPYENIVSVKTVYELVSSEAVVAASANSSYGNSYSSVTTGIVQTNSKSVTAVTGLVGAVSLVAIPIVYAPAFTNLIEVLEKALSIGGGILLGLLVSQGMDNDEIAAMEYAIIVADKAIQDAQIAFAGGVLERLRTALGILEAERTGDVAIPAPGYPGNDPSKSPGDGWEWRGNGEPGSPDGNWFNPQTGESIHPNLDHAPPIGPHYDYKPSRGAPWQRLFPDGTLEPK